ncbi:hypothetical protein EEL32_21295 [Brevibacillus laterosporus]|nr:hypothetical protein [Brevibacillus laterosporus]TPG79961.1 hypothetical protein EEL32_21295 [Brevibacillus laterosporus]
MSNIPIQSIVPRGVSRQKTDALPSFKVVSRKLMMFIEPERVFLHSENEETQILSVLTPVIFKS